ncbi:MULTISPECIES: hypothetical protein [Actinoalloteichus]|uniref:Uncharacterized protein n=1 Tax=Actinoalloteichus fjordicus TaxID=1612552 RepID=A0AAC9LD20_9PSEU|nr:MULTISPECIES: hypothetical protein [Actinoalloteichus]APU15086.1 hypothetical protein UA74_15165 [Actinoalloteichus fjordicus]APU21155.1 hypothetical protein UA75_15730 [Actinoalloteichus sp. GBA129-24]
MDETEKLDHQMMVIELCNGFTPHDHLALAALSGEELVAQYEARLALHEYVDAMWEQAKTDGHDPANDPRFSAVAGLRDLTAELLGNADNAGGGPVRR